MVVRMMTVMMIDILFSPSAGCQMTASSVKALFPSTPSPPAKEASARDPAVKQNVNPTRPFLVLVCALFTSVFVFVKGC